MDQIERVQTFRKWFTRGEVFVLPEAWDTASARVLLDAGFACVGTSAAAIAWSHGYRPHERVGTEELLLTAARIARGCQLPVNADLDVGATRTQDQTRRAVTAALAVGCAGVTIGDGSRNGLRGMVPAADMVGQIKAARQACADVGLRAMLTARTDAFMIGPATNSPFETAAERAEAYFEAGADCVLVPGVEHLQIVGSLAAMVGGPLAITVSLSAATNLMAYREAGVACVMLGSGLLRGLLGIMRRHSEELLASGDFAHLRHAIPTEEFETLLGAGR